jgi:hypothetical protein
LILAVNEVFGPHVGAFLPILVEQTNSPDWNAKKTAMDVIYTLAAILKTEAAPYKK